MDNRLHQNLLIVGHSHIAALQRAALDARWRGPGLSFLQIGDFKGKSRISKLVAIIRRFRHLATKSDAIVICVNGNQHNVYGLFAGPPLHDVIGVLEKDVLKDVTTWIRFLRMLTSRPLIVLPPPPPIGSDDHIRAFPGRFVSKLDELPIRCAADRRIIWQAQCKALERAASRLGVSVAKLPASVFSTDGLLAGNCYGNDASHANAVYGGQVLRALLNRHESPEAVPAHELDPDRPHYYVGLPDYAYWRQSVSEVRREDVDPVTVTKFVVRSTDKVATAGSCFAQHILKRLRANGFNCLISEPTPNVPDRQDPPAEFSARFGNIYTSRQLVQLFDRAFGLFEPVEKAWARRDGCFCDPFRPTVESNGFARVADVVEAAARHLQAVREMFTSLDVFIFTLGLTECWQSRVDSAAYPVAPGVAGGRYDKEKHELVNLTVGDVVSDLQSFIGKLRGVNPTAKIILTVSPIPLVATAIDRHVLVSTTYSKSVLRVAAGDVADANDFVEYFPSYEIITGPHASGQYFGSDHRAVTESGVDHVMNVFFSRMTSAGKRDDAHPAGAWREHVREMKALAKAACDEELLSKR